MAFDYSASSLLETPNRQLREVMTVPANGWGEIFRSQDRKVSYVERERLRQRYLHLMEDRPEFGRLVGPKGGLKQPVHRWFYYKEAFSPHLVEYILNHWKLEPAHFIDPFAGVGTSVWVAAVRGWASSGVEFLPVSAFVANVKASAPRADPARLIAQANQAVSSICPQSASFPDFNIADKAFDSDVIGRLLSISDSIAMVGTYPERDLLTVALLSVVEEVSHATKDGTSLRFHPPGYRRGRYGLRRTPRDVEDKFLEMVQRIANDLVVAQMPVGDIQIIQGDARSLSTYFPPAQFRASITSPPYPNRYDYTANYQLELGFGFVKDRQELKSLRRSQLRSHVECPWPEEKTIDLPALTELLRSLLAKGMSTNRVFRMLAGYFEDMNSVLAGMAHVLEDGGRWAIVVGNVQFSGEAVPVDLMLAELAQANEFDVEGIWVARYKNRNVQQMVKYGDEKARESILFLRRRGRMPDAAGGRA